MCRGSNTNNRLCLLNKTKTCLHKRCIDKIRIRNRLNPANCTSQGNCQPTPFTLLTLQPRHAQTPSLAIGIGRLLACHSSCVLSIPSSIQFFCIQSTSLSASRCLLLPRFLPLCFIICLVWSSGTSCILTTEKLIGFRCMTAIILEGPSIYLPMIRHSNFNHPPAKLLLVLWR